MTTTLQRHGRQGWAVSVDGVSTVGLTRTEAVELIAVGSVARITSPVCSQCLAGCCAAGEPDFPFHAAAGETCSAADEAQP